MREKKIELVDGNGGGSGGGRWEETIFLSFIVMFIFGDRLTVYKWNVALNMNAFPMPKGS